MPTLLDVKKYVANQLGSTDTTANTKRDNLTNFSRRQYYSEYPWTFTFRSDTVTITAQLGTIPTDYNEKWDPKVYTYTGDAKYDYAKVPWDDVDAYSTSSYVFGINKYSNQIKINQTTVASVTFDYHRIPPDAATDSSDDSDAEDAPDITAIGYLTVAHWWLSSERSTAKFQLFKDMYDQKIMRDRKADMMQQAVKGINLNPIAQGFNSRVSNNPPKGYVGRR